MIGIAKVARDAGLNPVTCPHCGLRIRTGAALFEGLFRAILERVRAGEEVMVKRFGVFRRAVTRGRVHAPGTTRVMGSKVYDAGGKRSEDVARVAFRQSRSAKAIINKEG